MNPIISNHATFNTHAMISATEVTENTEITTHQSLVSLSVRERKVDQYTPA